MLLHFVVDALAHRGGRAASKSAHKNFCYFLTMAQQAVSADIIPNSAVEIFSPKTEGTQT
jgi:hypothetical protein